MATTSLGISNQVTLAHGATVEFTVSWDWGDQTFNDWMPCDAWSDDGVDGVYGEYRLTVLSSVTKHPVLGSNQISKFIRNDDPDTQLNTSFRVAAVKISM
ncbi:MAG: hypothetical protein WA792_18400 [Pseudolabrys sp.]